MVELALKKLAKAVARIAKTEDWLWVEGAIQRHDALEGLTYLRPEVVGVPETLATRIDELNTQIMTWEDIYYNEALPEGEGDESFERKLQAARDGLEKLEDEREARYSMFTDEQRAVVRAGWVRMHWIPT